MPRAKTPIKDVPASPPHGLADIVDKYRKEPFAGVLASISSPLSPPSRSDAIRSEVTTLYHELAAIELTDARAALQAEVARYLRAIEAPPPEPQHSLDLAAPMQALARAHQVYEDACVRLRASVRRP